MITKEKPSVTKVTVAGPGKSRDSYYLQGESVDALRTLLGAVGTQAEPVVRRGRKPKKEAAPAPAAA